LRLPDGRSGRRREIDVSDTEITVAQYSRLIRNASHDGEISPGPEWPMNSVTWNDAARFCLALDVADGISSTEASYHEDGPSSYQPCPAVSPCHGYRLPTAEEFPMLCRAGTATSRYFGDSTSLLGFYVSYRGNSERAQPVALRKPNDLGLFDSLGNVTEWCDRPICELGVLYQATVGFSVMAVGDVIRTDQLRAVRNSVLYSWSTLGFRVARTVSDDQDAPQ
jgi:formylglycine-generating enzyme required for sulfatase activity